MSPCRHRPAQRLPESEVCRAHAAWSYRNRRFAQHLCCLVSRLQNGVFLHFCSYEGLVMAAGSAENRTPLLSVLPSVVERPSSLGDRLANSFKLFINACVEHSQDFALLAGPLAFLLLYFFLDIEDDTGKSSSMVAAMAWVFIWWVTEPIPLAVTALIPLFLLPFLRIQTASAVSKSYINDTVFLILGSFILAAAVRRHGLNKRMAIRTVMLFGSDPRLLLFGFCISAAFISMWVDNAAAAAMLMPMAVGVQQKVHAGFHPQCFPKDDEQEDHIEKMPKEDTTGSASKAGVDDASKSSPRSISLPEHEEQHLPRCLSVPRHGHLEKHDSKELSSSGRTMSLPLSYDATKLKRQTTMQLEKHLTNVLATMDPEDALKVEMDYCRGVAISIAFAVTIGGMSTLTGNAVNLVFSGIWETDFPKENPIYYLQWMLFALPLSVILVLVLWVVVCIWFCPRAAIKPVSASLHSYHMEDELARLGPMTSEQVLVVIAFGILVVLWMTKSITGESSGWAGWFDDYPGNGTVTVLVAVVLFVMPNPSAPKRRLMEWSECQDINWSILLLLGGGFALADGITSSGLSDVISKEMDFLEYTPYWAITPAIAVVTGIVTEFTSNTATASVFIPLVAEIALSINRHPLFLMVPAAVGSQFSFMLPIATAPNAIAYTQDSMRIKDMASPGFVLKIVAIIILSIFMPTLGALVFNTNSTINT